MTAIIGIFCQDGVVIGTDSSATYVAGNQPTIEQQQVKKIDILDGKILAGTGHVGIGQRFAEIVEQYWSNKKWSNQGKSKSPISICTELCAEGCKNFSSTFLAPGCYGAMLAFKSTHGSKDQHCLCEFQVSNFQPELKTDALWFVSMGSGQNITDPFLGMLRKVFWKETRPRLSEGIFAAAWTLSHVIELNPGGIGGELQIATLDQRFGAKLLSHDEISEHANMVQGVEKHLSEFKEILSGGNSAPQLPSPAS